MSEAPSVLAIREKHSMSRADLAREAGVDVSTVCRWENDGVPERGPARAFLDRLASEPARKRKVRAA